MLLFISVDLIEKQILVFKMIIDIALQKLWLVCFTINKSSMCCFLVRYILVAEFTEELQKRLKMSEIHL